MSPLRRSRRRSTVIAALLGAVALGLASPGTAIAAPAVRSAVASCPTGAFSFTSTLTDGSFQIGRNASSTGATGTACGSITGDGNGGLLSVVSKDNVSFAPTTTSVLFLKLPTRVAATGDMSGPTTLNADGTIGVSLGGPVLVTTSVLGSTCSFPLTLNLTTGTSGSMAGKPLSSDGAGGFAGTLVANDFGVPALKPSRSCNVLVTTLTNTMLGLPLKAGKSSVSFHLALKLGS